MTQASIWSACVVLMERKGIARINKVNEGCRPQEKTAGGDF